MIYKIHIYILYIFKDYLWKNMKKTENEACLCDGEGGGWEQTELEKLLFTVHPLLLFGACFMCMYHLFENK